MALTGDECEDKLGEWRSDCAQYVTDEAACKGLFDYWVAEGCKFGGDDQYAIFHNRVCKECLKKEETSSGGAAATESAQEMWDKLIPLLNSWLTDIFDSLGEALDDMVNTIASWVGNLVKNITGVFDTIGAVIQGIVDDIWSWFTGVLDEIKILYNKVEVWISGVIDSAKDWIVQAYKDVSQWLWELAVEIGDAIKKVYQWIGEKLDDALKWMGQAVKDIGKAIWDLLVWTGDQLKIAYDATLKPIVDWFGRMIDDFKNAVKKIGEWFADIDREVKDFVTGLKDGLTMGFEDMLDGLPDIFWGTLEKVGSTIMNLPDEFGDFLTDALSTAIIAQLRIQEEIARKVLKTGVPDIPGT